MTHPSGDEAWQKQALAVLSLTINEKSGHLGKLTAEEEQVLKEFRELHREKLVADQDLLRFLRARQFNLTKASKMLADTVAWRIQNRPEDFLLANYVAMCKKDFGFVQGFDKMRRPVVWFYSANHDPADSTQAWEYSFLLLEMAVKNLPPGQDGVTVCFDLTGWSRKNSDLKLTIKTIQTLQVSPVHPSFRALSGRLKFTVRRDKFNKWFSLFAEPLPRADGHDPHHQRSHHLLGSSASRPGDNIRVNGTSQK